MNKHAMAEKIDAEEFDFVSGSVVKLKADSDFAGWDPVYLTDDYHVASPSGDVYIGRAVNDAKEGQMVDVVVFYHP